MRMNRCRVEYDELNHDFAQSALNRDFELTKEARQQRVKELARQFIKGAPVEIYLWGSLYTRDDLLVDVQEHDLFDKAVFAAYGGDHAPMKDLVIRCAQRAVAEYLYPGNEDKLGFIR